MTTPAPARKGLIDEIRERIKQGPLSEIEYHGFVKRARKELEPYPENGYAALGILAATRGDVEAMRDNHEKALSLSGHSSLQHRNYSISLFLHDMNAEGHEHARSAIEKDPLDMLSLDLYIHSCFHQREHTALYSAFKTYTDYTSEIHHLDVELGYSSAYESVDAMLSNNELSPWEAEAFRDMLLDTEEDISAHTLMGAESALHSWD